MMKQLSPYLLLIAVAYLSVGRCYGVALDVRSTVEVVREEVSGAERVLNAEPEPEPEPEQASELPPVELIEEPQQAMESVQDEALDEALESDLEDAEAELGPDEEWVYVDEEEYEDDEPEPSAPAFRSPVVFFLPLLALLWFVMMRIGRRRTPSNSQLAREEAFSEALSYKGRKEVETQRCTTKSSKDGPAF